MFFKITPAVNPSAALCATAPLTQGSQGVDSPAEKFTISRACGSRCTGEPGANSAPAAARADSGFLSYFLFQKKHRRHNSTKLYRLQSETTKVSFATFLFQRKRLRHSVCRQPLSRALRDSSPYTGEPRSAGNFAPPVSRAISVFLLLFRKISDCTANSAPPANCAVKVFLLLFRKISDCTANSAPPVNYAIRVFLCLLSFFPKRK